MIKNFKHRALKRLFEKNDQRRLDPLVVPKLKRILARLEVAKRPEDMDIHNWRLQPLVGDREGYWAVRVSGNWRIVFRFDDVGVCDVNLVDYH